MSGGSTGAALAAGLFEIKRDRGIYRPALAIPVPIPGHPFTLVDVGANTEARPEHLVQFAFMGAALAQIVLGIERPRVGLLSNGEEPAKGTATVVEAHAALAAQAAAAPGALTSSATSRAPISRPAPPTSSSPTGSPATSS